MLEELNLSIPPLLKKKKRITNTHTHIRLEHAGIDEPSVWFINATLIYILMGGGKEVSHGSTLHMPPTNWLLLAAKQKLEIIF